MYRSRTVGFVFVFILTTTALAPHLNTGKNPIPLWDGTPAHSRRYSHEVKWYNHGTKKEDRKYVVARLMPGLTGAARERAIQWDPAVFEEEEDLLNEKPKEVKEERTFKGFAEGRSKK